MVIFDWNIFLEIVVSNTDAHGRWLRQLWIVLLNQFAELTSSSLVSPVLENFSKAIKTSLCEGERPEEWDGFFDFFLQGNENFWTSLATRVSHVLRSGSVSPLESKFLWICATHRCSYIEYYLNCQSFRFFEREKSGEGSGGGGRKYYCNRRLWSFSLFINPKNCKL